MKERVYKISINDENLYNKFLKTNEIYVLSENKSKKLEELDKNSQISLLDLIKKLNKNDFVYMYSNEGIAIGLVLDKLQVFDDRIAAQVKFIENKEDINFNKLSEEELLKKAKEIFKEYKIDKTLINNEKENSNSGKISFIEPEERGLAINQNRYLMPRSNVKIDFTNKKAEDSLDINYTEKDDSESKDFEIIFEVGPKAESKNNRKKNNLPLEREKKDFYEEFLELQEMYRNLLKRQADLSYKISNSFLRESLEMQKNMADNYFDLINKMLNREWGNIWKKKI